MMEKDTKEVEEGRRRRRGREAVAVAVRKKYCNSRSES